MPAGGGLTLGTALQVGSAIGGAVKGIGSLFGAKSDEQKAQEELAKLKTPFYKVQDEFYQNRNIAADLAQGGLPDTSKNYYTSEAQRGLASTISGMNRAGGDGSPNDAGNYLDVYLRNINRVAAQDAETKLANIQNFINLNREVAGQKITQFTLNELRPYERRLKELTNRIAAAKQNQNNAWNTAIGSVSAAGTALSNADLMAKLFSKNNTNGTTVQQMGAVGNTLGNQGASAVGNVAGQIPVGGTVRQQTANNNAPLPGQETVDEFYLKYPNG